MHTINMCVGNVSKSVVGVDRPMKTSSLQIQKPYQRKTVLIAVILSKNIFGIKHLYA